MNQLEGAYQRLLAPFRLYFSDRQTIINVLTVFILILAFIFFEYFFGITSNFQDEGILTVYFLALCIPIFVNILSSGEKSVIRSIHFWVLIFSIISALYLFDTNKFYIHLIREFCPLEFRYIVYRVFDQLSIWLFLSIPYLSLKIFSFLPVRSIYPVVVEVTRLKISYSTYWIILLPLTCLVIIASFFPSFRGFYPRAPVTDPMLGKPIGLFMILLFELAYVLAFVATEWFFRRYLIKAFTPFFGKESILVMTFLYVAVHFQKPLLETISSAFGGFSLGIFAYYTGQIRGGILIHVSIAITMEIMGFYWLYH
jgi:hypothetical protein